MFGERGFENHFFIISISCGQKLQSIFFSIESLPTPCARMEYWYWRGDKKEFDWVAGLLRGAIIQ